MMSGGTLIIVVISAILAAISGWLVPILFKSKRPLGLGGDILVCTVLTAVLAYLEWQFILPALGFETGWLSILMAVGDSLALGWISLWVLRKIKPAE
jgi:hypothetical protein